MHTKCKAVLIIVLVVSKYMKKIVVVAILGNMFRKGESCGGAAHKEAIITLIICDRSKFYMSNYCIQINTFNVKVIL